jgi:hypothetical protein
MKLLSSGELINAAPLVQCLVVDAWFTAPVPSDFHGAFARFLPAHLYFQLVPMRLDLN